MSEVGLDQNKDIKMISTSIICEFGNANLAVDCAQAKDIYYVVIRNLKNEGEKVGDIIPKEKELNCDNEIYLVFPNEFQMISVMAAFGNKTYEQVKEKWDNREIKKEWVDKS